MKTVISSSSKFLYFSCNLKLRSTKVYLRVFLKKKHKFSHYFVQWSSVSNNFQSDQYIAPHNLISNFLGRSPIEEKLIYWLSSRAWMEISRFRKKYLVTTMFTFKQKSTFNLLIAIKKLWTTLNAQKSALMKALLRIIGTFSKKTSYVARQNNQKSNRFVLNIAQKRG